MIPTWQTRLLNWWWLQKHRARRAWEWARGAWRGADGSMDE